MLDAQHPSMSLLQTNMCVFAADIAHEILSVDKAGKHWQTIFPGKVLVMPYEKLVSNLTAAAEDMLQHCGMPWDDAVLQFHETQRNVHTASLAQVSSPLGKLGNTTKAKHNKEKAYTVRHEFMGGLGWAAASL